MNSKGLMIPIILLMLILPFDMALASGSGSGTAFVLKENAVVFDEVVKMKDVALMDNATVRQIGDMVITASPKIGSKLTIGKREIYEKLIGNGISDPVLRGAARVQVNRNGKSVHASYFKNQILRYIQTHSKWKSGLSLTVVSNKRFVVPDTGVSWEITPVNGQDFFGNILFKVKAVKNNLELFSDWIVARLKIKRLVAISNRTLGRNELIQKKDIRWETREITAFLKNAVLDEKQIIGKRAGRTIRTNSVITENNLESAFLVRRGYLSSLVAKYKSIHAVADVIPMSNGKYGDLIKVVNKNTKTVLTAMVIGQNKMEVKIR